MILSRAIQYLQQCAVKSITVIPFKIYFVFALKCSFYLLSKTETIQTNLACCEKVIVPLVKTKKSLPDL